MTSASCNVQVIPDTYECNLSVRQTHGMHTVTRQSNTMCFVAIRKKRNTFKENKIEGKRNRFVLSQPYFMDRYLFKHRSIAMGSTPRAPFSIICAQQ